MFKRHFLSGTQKWEHMGKKSVKLKFSHVPIAHLATFRLSRIIKNTSHTWFNLSGIQKASKRFRSQQKIRRKTASSWKHVRSFVTILPSGSGPPSQPQFQDWVFRTLLAPALRHSIASRCGPTCRTRKFRTDEKVESFWTGREEDSKKRDGKSEVVVIWKKSVWHFFSVFWANTP